VLPEDKKTSKLEQLQHSTSLKSNLPPKSAEKEAKSLSSKRIGPGKVNRQNAFTHLFSWPFLCIIFPVKEAIWLFVKLILKDHLIYKGRRAVRMTFVHLLRVPMQNGKLNVGLPLLLPQVSQYTLPEGHCCQDDLSVRCFVM